MTEYTSIKVPLKLIGKINLAKSKYIQDNPDKKTSFNYEVLEEALNKYLGV